MAHRIASFPDPPSLGTLVLVAVALGYDLDRVGVEVTSFPTIHHLAFYGSERPPKPPVTILGGSGIIVEVGTPAVVHLDQLAAANRTPAPGPVEPEPAAPVEPEPVVETAEPPPAAPSPDPSAGPYTCDICDRTFPSATSIGSHRWRSHQVRGASRRKTVESAVRGEAARLDQEAAAAAADGPAQRWGRLAPVYRCDCGHLSPSYVALTDHALDVHDRRPHRGERDALSNAERGRALAAAGHVES